MSQGLALAAASGRAAQYSNVSDFGLMYYNARWLDPSLGRFASADSIVPAGVQGYDRYAYVNNSPVNYTDPTGHRACDDVDQRGRCTSLTTSISFRELTKDRSDFDRDLLRNLQGAGIDGQFLVDYILDHGIEIGFRHHLYAGATWDARNNALYLNRDPKSTKPDDPFVLNLVAHEVVHLQQGMRIAATKQGEFEAWRTGFRIQHTFSPLREGSSAYRIAFRVEVWDIPTFSSLVHEYNKGVPRGWMYNMLFDLLPDVPLGMYLTGGS